MKNMGKITLALCALFCSFNTNGMVTPDELVINDRYIATHTVDEYFELVTDKKVRVEGEIYRNNVDFSIKCASFCNSYTFIGKHIRIKSNQGDIFNSGSLFSKGIVIFNASDSVINSGTINSNGIWITANDLFSIGKMCSHYKNIVLNARQDLFHIGDRILASDSDHKVDKFCYQYNVFPRYPRGGGNCVIPDFEWTPLESLISANMQNGVCNIVTNKNIAVTQHLFYPDIKLNIVCEGFFNMERLEFASIKVCANRNLVNAGLLNTKKGDIDLQANKILISGLKAVSSEDIHVNAQRIFIFGILESEKDIKSESNMFYSFGSDIEAKRDIIIHTQKDMYTCPVLIFNNSF